MGWWGWELLLSEPTQSLSFTLIWGNGKDLVGTSHHSVKLVIRTRQGLSRPGSWSHGNAQVTPAFGLERPYGCGLAAPINRSWSPRLWSWRERGWSLTARLICLQWLQGVVVRESHFAGQEIRAMLDCPIPKLGGVRSAIQAGTMEEVLRGDDYSKNFVKCLKIT